MKFFVLGRALALCGFVMAALFPAAAHADTIFTLTQDTCTNGCGTSPFGTVTLQQVDNNTVDVTVGLFNGNKFVTNGNHEALSFNVNGAAVTISGFGSGFSIDTGAINNPGFGSFGYGLVASGTIPPPLTFVVSRATGLSISDFVGNSQNIFFATDILSGTTGNTGAVGALAGVNTQTTGGQTPEPGTMLLTVAGVGLLGIGSFRKARS
jgi:hypothetical protein